MITETKHAEQSTLFRSWSQGAWTRDVRMTRSAGTYSINIEMFSVDDKKKTGRKETAVVKI